MMEIRNQNVSKKRNCHGLLIIFVFLAFLFFVDKTQACSCVPAGPPCQAFWQADAVFLATVKSKSVVTTQVDGEAGSPQQMVSVRFLVDEVYRGLLGGSDVEVLTAMNSAACGYNFEKGKRYLVYANENQNKFRTSICSRTSLLTDARKDLLYFQNLPPEGSGASILVKVLKRSASEGVVPMQGVKVTAEGPDGSFNGRTDGSGQYEFKHLPPGKYKIKSEIAPTPSSHWQAEVTVDDRACAAVELSSNIEGAIHRSALKDVLTR